MTRKVYNVGGGRHSEAALSALLSQLLDGDVARGLNIEPTGSAGLSVRITAGTGQIRVSQFHSRVIQSDAAETTTAVPAPTSNPRRNLVVAYIDPAVTPTTSVIDNTNGVFKFAVIRGAEAATPQIPTNTAVTAALGTENWIPLGDFRTNVGATSVTQANITDQRKMILVTPDKLDSASFPGITTQANTGTGGGTMTLISIGNLRIAYGASASKSSGASPHDPKAYTVIFPSGFFSNPPVATTAPGGPLSGVATQSSTINAVSSTTLSYYQYTTAGSGSAVVQWLAIGS